MTEPKLFQLFQSYALKKKQQVSYMSLEIKHVTSEGSEDDF